MAPKAVAEIRKTICELYAEQYNYTPEWAKRTMLEAPLTLVNKGETGALQTVITLPGISLGNGQVNAGRWYGALGPTPHKIMMVNCWPNKSENDERSLFRGQWVDEFTTLCESTGFGAYVNDIYYTTYCKYFIDGKKTAMPKEEVAEFKEYFLKELELVKPDLVILLGAKTLKAVFGAKATYEQYKNRTVAAADNDYGVNIAAIPDFSSILHMPEMREVIALDMTRLVNELGGSKASGQVLPTNYVYCDNLAQLDVKLAEITATYTGWLALDCEWGDGNHLDGYLRCMQLSWAPGEALVVIFSRPGKQFTELGLNAKETWAKLKAFIENGKTKLIGHFIRADLPWLVHNGVNVAGPTLNGWDTALAGHLLNENWAQGLEVYVARHTDLGRYELELNDWIKANKYDVEQFSYGGIPDDILLPYSAKDADATFRIALLQMAEMSLPEHKRIKELFEAIVMPATMPILELEMTGMLVDLPRLELLSQKYSEKKVELSEQLCTILNWPEFNPDSPAQKAAALFSWTKKTQPPKGANLATYTPIKATNDADWAKAMEQGKEAALTPSTDRSVLLGLLGEHKDCPLLNAMLLYTAISQTVKTFTGEFTPTEDGTNYTLEGGIKPKIWSDGRVHTRIRQTVETGRYGHSNPNMAQLPKTAEELVGKAFKDTTKIPSIRSCFTVPEDWCIVDCDWVQAELFVMAWLSGDTAMQAKLLDKGSDFHSEVAMQMFKLNPPPEDYTKGKKDWLKENNWSKFRTIAKTITFGIAYGRGATAIKSAVSLEGVEVTQEEAEAAVQAFKTTFPDLAEWLVKQQQHVTERRYVENGFGRRRRFEPTADKENLAHQRRQAMNAPIQGTVGDLMSLALLNLYMIREVEKPHLQYKILMSVHDQILVACPINQVDETLEAVRLAMCERCKVPNNDMVLDIDPEVCIRWGESLTEADVTKYPSLTKYRK